MRCTDALEHMAALPDGRRLADHPELSAHLEACPSCGGEWRRHLALLEALGSPPALPPFPDLSPAVLSRLDRRGPLGSEGFRRMAIAALALLALLLGYLWGAAAGGASSSPQDSVTATYQEALSGLPSGSAEVAYLGGAAQSAAYRSSP